MTYSALMPNPAVVVRSTPKITMPSPAAAATSSGRTIRDERNFTCGASSIGSSFELGEPIVGILIDSPLPLTGLRPATALGPGDFSPAREKSPKVGVLIVDDES